MGHVAALLISYMTEDQAFWTFNAVMRGQTLHLREYHLGDALQLSLTVWLYLLKSQFKRFYHYCTQIRVKHIDYLRVWFMHFFLSVDFLPVLRLRIWDRIAAFGGRAIYSLGLALVSLMEKDLLKRGRDDLTLMLQSPIIGIRERDWGNVIKKWDRFWISFSNYGEVVSRQRTMTWFHKITRFLIRRLPWQLGFEDEAEVVFPQRINQMSFFQSRFLLT
jgi:hypothetical protein